MCPRHSAIVEAGAKEIIGLDGEKNIELPAGGPHIVCAACGVVTNSIASPFCDKCKAEAP